MADKKNTQSILENIRKKIQKFDQPRKTEGSISTSMAMGDEFEYISSSASKKSEAPPASSNQPAPAQTSVPNDDHLALEKELDASFSDFLNKASDDTINNAVQSVGINKPAAADDLNFDVFESPTAKKTATKNAENTNPIHDERLNFNSLESFKEPAAQNKVEEKPAIEKEPMKNNEIKAQSTNDSAKNSEEEFHIEIEAEHDHKEVTPSDHSAEKKDDDFLKPQIEENFETIKTDKSVVTSSSDTKQPNKEAEDDFLKMNAETEEAHEVKVSPEEMSKVNQLSDFLGQTLNKSEPKKEEKAALAASKTSQTLDAPDSLLDQNTVEKVSSSLKKLTEAKDKALDVASLAKSDKFDDITSQLLEQKLEKWLNENLPEIVERIVREEIKKLTH